MRKYTNTVMCNPWFSGKRSSTSWCTSTPVRAGTVHVCQVYMFTLKYCFPSGRLDQWTEWWRRVVEWKDDSSCLWGTWKDVIIVLYRPWYQLERHRSWGHPAQPRGFWSDGPWQGHWKLESKVQRWAPVTPRGLSMFLVGIWRRGRGENGRRAVSTRVRCAGWGSSGFIGTTVTMKTRIDGRKGSNRCPTINGCRWCRGDGGGGDVGLIRFRRLQLLLVLDQLTHEVHVWWDDASFGLDEVVGLVEWKAFVVHEVCDADGRRSADACLTVNEHLSLAVTRLVCKNKHTTTSVVWQERRRGGERKGWNKGAGKGGEEEERSIRCVKNMGHSLSVGRRIWLLSYNMTGIM